MVPPVWAGAVPAALRPRSPPPSRHHLSAAQSLIEYPHAYRHNGDHSNPCRPLWYVVTRPDIEESAEQGLLWPDIQHVRPDYSNQVPGIQQISVACVEDLVYDLAE